MKYGAGGKEEKDLRESSREGSDGGHAEGLM